ncbi:MAG TPA: hypothetical protein PK637_14170 [Flavobacteriales bacterium]|nr:hypothetical protein [Flavobacteriales bacterium]HRE97911.1 hypothetical protein [Flavobacteriales bacterium]HRJ36954.1 hypothetical protein [Flavobacteriales bacterium]HRJ40201.1 hypothetical protein [Flavobacteriales bacterium]
MTTAKFSLIVLFITSLAFSSCTGSEKKSAENKPINSDTTIAKEYEELSEVNEEDALTQLLFPMVLNGSVDNYKIEMEISNFNPGTNEITGKYKYDSQKAYLELKGKAMGTTWMLEEYSKGKNTGTFYLNIDHKSAMGWWTDEKKSLAVDLASSSRISSVNSFDFEYNNFNPGKGITGSYSTEYYWVNDFHNDPTQPALEIGFNGGYAVFEEQKNGNLKFQLEVICGPTYHFAYAEGIAEKKGKKYIYTSSEYSDETPCEIVFTIDGNIIHAEANQSMGCGFGARAYLSHDFTKFSDKFQMGEGVSLEKLKGLK